MVAVEAQQVGGACRVEHPVVDRCIGTCALASAGDELTAAVDRYDRGTQGRHAACKSSRTAGDIENPVATGDLQQTLGGGFDEQRLKVVALADAIVPPAGVGIPDAAILFDVFGKVGVHRLTSAGPRVA